MQNESFIMNSKRPAIVKNILRAGSGGVAVVVALILMMFLKGGSGDGESDTPPSPMASVDESSSSSTTTTTPSPSTDASNEDSPENGGLTAEEAKALEEDVLGIMIDEYDYFLVVPGEDVIYRPTKIDRLLELAGQAKGDSNGIRVRIVRRETSRTKAEVDLKTALAGIGIGEDAVYMPEELLPK